MDNLFEKDTQGELFGKNDFQPFEESADNNPVTCLGMTFANDDERREYFRNELRKKLPELKQIEGFPIGEDEDIITLSDPPYYTACPNPWLNDFIAEWEQEKVELEKEGKRKADFQVNEPYNLAINERKNSDVYNAHSYHTKVPPEVVMNYYLYYTQPGDIVLDGFAGTGMAGVAANYCNNPTPSQKSAFDKKWKESFLRNPVWGKRNCILGDISPITSFIAYNYTNTISKNEFTKAANAIYNELYDKLGHLYAFEPDKGNKGIINYVVWSEEQICHACNNQFVYWDAAVNMSIDQQLDTYPCPHCGSLISKSKSIKAMRTDFDELLQQSVEQCCFVPVFINYTVNGKRYERNLSHSERNRILEKQHFEILSTMPISKLANGDKTSDPFRLGVNYLHQFYTRRNFYILSYFKKLIEDYNCSERLKKYLMVWFTSCQSRLHQMNRYAPKHHRHVGPLANTFYISATPTEISPFYFIKSKIEDNSLLIESDSNVVNQIVSASNTAINANSIDYIFTDPPFGHNIMYSELNFIWESWLNLRTNNKEEAITNKTQNKSLFDYQDLMTKCFKEYYRVLKPGKWITVEFSNTSSSVWNTIQYSLREAGFVIAVVTDLNKGRAGLHGIVGVTAVNQDLAISCYKPTDELRNKFNQSVDKSLNAMDFIEELLLHLPVHIEKDKSTTAVIERSPKILYDRLISYYVQNGYSIPMDAQDFQSALRDRFIERDGMFFTASQVVEYEEKRKTAESFIPMGLIVSDEANGIEWLRNELSASWQTYQDLQPKWMQALNGARKGDIIPELRDLLNENFIEESDGRWRTPNAQDDVDKEKLRTKALLREWKIYVEAAQKPRTKLKEVRVEALRAGFRQCYKDKDFATIILVGDKIPQNLLTEDEVLLQFYDIASSKV